MKVVISSVAPLPSNATGLAFARLFREIFGDDAGINDAVANGNWTDVSDRLKPYAYGFPGGKTPVSSYEAPALTPAMIAQAHKDPSVRKLAMKYEAAERLLYWLQQSTPAQRLRVARRFRRFRRATREADLRRGLGRATLNAISA